MKKKEQQVKEEINCFGHPNITAKHGTTFEFTKDKSIGKAADCIIGIKANKGAKDLDPEFKKQAQKETSKIEVRIEIKGNREDEIIIKGEGHPELSYEHPTDLVGRTSTYKCERTLMIKANKSSNEIPREFIKKLKKPETEMKVTLKAY